VKKFKISIKEVILYTGLIVLFMATMAVTDHNDRYYKQTIGKVMKVQLVGQKESIDQYRNKEMITTQKLFLTITNGIYKGQQLELNNEYSLSGAFDAKYNTGDRVFLNLDASTGMKEASITGLKRDKYIALAAWIFVILIILIGKRKGVYSVLSLVLNVVLFSFALDLYLKGFNLLFLCGLIVIVFTIFSLLLVSGNNEKTYAAVISTIIGTFLSLLIACIVLILTREKGMRYEEMEYLTHPPYEIFMAEILVGSLGAIMDIAITMSSSVFELYHNNTGLTSKELISSGTEIGKDIMGTMINVLFFAYVSGAIPMILIYLKNGLEVAYTLNMNLSLELVRALTGSIGIVLTIPIALYTTVFYIDRRRAVR
jgi:uncharacterized membrane protein